MCSVLTSDDLGVHSAGLVTSSPSAGSPGDGVSENLDDVTDELFSAIQSIRGKNATVVRVYKTANRSLRG